MNELVVEKAVETTVEAVGVSKVYWDGDRSLQVLKNVNLTVKRGEGVAILGPSGSGKTTLLNVLSGLDRADAGRVSLCGKELAGLNENQKADLRNRSLGFIFQFYHLLPELTALENVMLPMLVGRKERTEAAARARSLLARVGLAERFSHFPSELSGGEEQRVAIARALANDPEILFCDEPTGNLDAESGRAIAELLAGLYREEKKTVLIVTHDEKMAKRADRIWNIVTGEWEK